MCEKLLLREKLSLCEKLLLIHQRDAVIDVSGVLHTLLDCQVTVLTLVLWIILRAGIYFVIHRAVSGEGSQLHALDLLLQSAGLVFAAGTFDLQRHQIVLAGFFVGSGHVKSSVGSVALQEGDGDLLAVRDIFYIAGRDRYLGMLSCA